MDHSLGYAPELFDKFPLVDTFDGNLLAPRCVTRNYGNGRLRYSQLSSEVLSKFAIGSTVNGRPLYANLDCIPVKTTELSSTGLRLDIDVYDSQRILMSQLRMSCSANHATRGVMSIIPIGGMILRSGSTIQSVRR